MYSDNKAKILITRSKFALNISFFVGNKMLWIRYDLIDKVNDKITIQTKRDADAYDAIKQNDLSWGYDIVFGSEE